MVPGARMKDGAQEPRRAEQEVQAVLREPGAAVAQGAQPVQAPRLSSADRRLPRRHRQSPLWMQSKPFSQSTEATLT